jgi:hypothetical protein
LCFFFPPPTLHPPPKCVHFILFNTWPSFIHVLSHQVYLTIGRLLKDCWSMSICLHLSPCFYFGQFIWTRVVIPRFTPLHYIGLTWIPTWKLKWNLSFPFVIALLTTFPWLYVCMFVNGPLSLSFNNSQGLDTLLAHFPSFFLSFVFKNFLGNFFFCYYFMWNVKVFI